jgi:REP element-mobilizing transposase RayT
VQRGKTGVQRPNPRLAKHRAAIAAQPPVRFDDDQQCVLLEGARELCAEHEWRLHAASATPTHLHVLVSWTDQTIAVRDITTTLKRQLGRRLSKHKGTEGNRWFSRGEDEKPVTDREHFDYLCTEYLPAHIHQNGRFWLVLIE